MDSDSNKLISRSSISSNRPAIGQFLVIAGFFLTALSLPLLDWRFYIKGLEFNISDFLILLTAAAYFINQLIIRLSGQKVRAWRWPLGWSAAIFLTVALLSAALSPWPLPALKYTIRIIFFAYFLYIALPFNALDSWKKWRWPFWGVILGGAYSAVIGLLSLARQDLADTFFRVQPIAIFNHWWLGSNHNLLAEFLVISNFFVLAWGRLGSSYRRRAADIIFILLSIVILLTFSRAAWLAVAVQLALWWLSLADRRRQIGWAIALCLAIVVATPLWLKMDSLQEANYSATENRVLLTEIAWQGLSQKPILGWGGGQFLKLVDNNLRFLAKYGDPIDSHGVLQKVAAENGGLGLVALLILVVSLLSVWWRGWLRHPRARLWLTPLILGSVGGLFFQLFNTSYYKGRVWLPVAISLAAIRLLDYEKKSKK